MKHSRSKRPRKRLMRRVVFASPSDITYAKLKRMGFTFIPGGMAVKYRDRKDARITVRIEVSPAYTIASWKTGKGIVPGKNDDFEEARMHTMKGIRAFCYIAFNQS